MIEQQDKQNIEIKQFCIDSAIKIQSLYPQLPLIVDINAIPKTTNFNISDWDKYMKETGIAYVDSSKGDIKQMDIIDIILSNAKEIYKWIIEDDNRS